MKKLIIACVIVAICTACGGGSSIDKALSKVNKAVEQVEKNKSKMTDEDWNKLNKELEEPIKVLTDALDDNNVGVMKKMKILAATAKWATIFAEVGIKELEKATGVERENLGKELDKAAKELEKNSGDVNKDLEKAAKELQENLSKELEKAAKELQKASEKK